MDQIQKIHNVLGTPSPELLASKFKRTVFLMFAGLRGVWWEVNVFGIRHRTMLGVEHGWKPVEDEVEFTFIIIFGAGKNIYTITYCRLLSLKTRDPKSESPGPS